MLKKYEAYNPTGVYQLTIEDAILQNQTRIREWEQRHRIFGCEYKTKTTEAGRMLEIEIYPGFLNRNDYSRALKKQRTPAAQKKQNEKNAQRKLIRRVHANFEPGDIFFTGGFLNENQPRNIDECRKEIVRFLDRLKYHAGRADAGPIKYIYVIERSKRKDGASKYHVHILLGKNAGANQKGVPGRDWIESQWKGGDYANTKSLQWKHDSGFTGISRYFTKQFEQLHDTERAGLRHWGQSLGLKKWSKPPKASYGQFSKRKVIKMVKAPAAIKQAFEKEFLGYSYFENYPCEIRYSDAVEGFYLYCRMYKKE